MSYPGTSVILIAFSLVSQVSLDNVKQKVILECCVLGQG